MRRNLRLILLKAFIGGVAGGLSALTIGVVFPSVLSGLSPLEFLVIGLIGGSVAALVQALLEVLFRD